MSPAELPGISSTQDSGLDRLLSERARRALVAVCDTLIPALEAKSGQSANDAYYAASASILGVPQRMAQAFAELPDEGDRNRIRRLLALFEHPAFNLVMGGGFRAFSGMDATRRERYLLKWAESRLGPRRAAFNALKRLTAFFFFTEQDDSGGNPAWPAIGYPAVRAESAMPSPLVPRAAVSQPIRPLAVERDQILDCDAVVIGSGAGGGVVAGELQAAGKDVIVLEQGGHYSESDFAWGEGEGIARLYLESGRVTSSDQGMLILAGSCLGGGTVVNYTTSFPTPASVREEWSREHGLKFFTGSEYEASLKSVMQRIHVNVDHNRPSGRDALMRRGLERLGWHVDLMPRNVKRCDQDELCGRCGFGCRLAAKQSTLVTYLSDAYAAGARIVVYATAERVLVERGRATGVIATVRDPLSGAAHRLTVRAQAVISACGAVHSPALLIRSGVQSPALGRNLFLHPATSVWGLFAEEVNPWSGTLQAVYSDELADLDDGYGVKFETAPIHPGFAGLGLPWRSGREFKALVERLGHITLVGVLTRDRYGGRVTVNRRGVPRVHYRLSPYDRNHLKKGIEGGARILEAAGAARIFAPHTRWLSYEPGRDKFEGFLARVGRAGYGSNELTLVSFHQMGGCCMGSDRTTGVVDEQNEVYGVKGLFVADASTFPSASGVNPMLTIMAIAHRAAQCIKGRV